MVELLEVERELRAEFVRGGLGHQHRFALERRREFDDETDAGVVSAAQPVERMARCGERRLVDHESIGAGPRRRDGTAGVDHEVASECVGAGAGHRHPPFERRHLDRPDGAAWVDCRARRCGSDVGGGRRRLRLGRDHVVVADRHVLASTVVPTLPHLRGGVVFAAAVRTRDRHAATLPTHPGDRTHVRSPWPRLPAAAGP
jgi:hypothetical protein